MATHAVSWKAAAVGEPLHSPGFPEVQALMALSVPHAVNPDPMLGDSRRLDAVRRTGLLDTPPEETFDRMTALVRRVTGASAACLSIVDDQRDFHKSCTGFDIALLADRPMEGRTLCRHTVASGVPLVLEDIAHAAMFVDMSQAQALGIRAYVGVPLSLDGQPIGALCAMGFAPRPWSAHEVELLTELAAIVERDIALRVQLRDARDRVRALRDALQARETATVKAVHDLRNPLNATLLWGELLSRVGLAEEQVKIVANMRQAGHQMEKLIRTLLETSTSEPAA